MTIYLNEEITILCGGGDVLVKSTERRRCDQGIEGFDFRPGTAGQ